jgi:hypothetical protein
MIARRPSAVRVTEDTPVVRPFVGAVLVVVVVEWDCATHFPAHTLCSWLMSAGPSPALDALLP